MSDSTRKECGQRARTVWAIAWGILTHGLFVLAVGGMALALFAGLQPGLGRLQGSAAWLANLALALQFPLLHSFLLTPRGRALLARAAPGTLGTDLSSTTYAAVASLQLLATFALWSPSGVVWWTATGAALWASTAAFAASWLLLGKAMYDAGLEIQSGSLGWTSVLRGRRPAYRPFLPERGLFRVCRQPVYVAFALTLWTAPRWTPDRLLLAVLWTAYCLAGPLHKEHRYIAWYGDAFRRYQRRVPYWLPAWARRVSPLRP